MSILAQGHHPFVACDGDSILVRDIRTESDHQPQADLRYEPLNMKLVDLSYAGRLTAHHASLDAISESKVGDPLRFDWTGKAWALLDRHGRTIGRMRRNFFPPKGWEIHQAEVGAIVRWSRADNAEEYREIIQRSEWETVLPDIVYSRPTGARY